MRRTKQPGTTICSVRLPVSQVYTYRNEKHNSKALSTSCTTRDRMYSVRKSTVAFCLLCYSFGAAHCYSNTPIKPADDVSKMPENGAAPSKLPVHNYDDGWSHTGRASPPERHFVRTHIRPQYYYYRYLMPSGLVACHFTSACKCKKLQSFS